jgi:hypothetical protein
MGHVAHRKMERGAEWGSQASRAGWGLSEQLVKAATVSRSEWGLSKRRVKAAAVSAMSRRGRGWRRCGDRTSGRFFFFFCGSAFGQKYGMDVLIVIEFSYLIHHLH